MEELAGAALEATDFCKAMRNTPEASCIASHDEELSEATGLLDVQLLAAYRDDWKLRVQDVDSTVSSQEFVRRYRELCKAREKKQQATANLEAKQAQHASTAVQALAIKKQLVELLPRLEDLCVQELRRLVHITLPWEDKADSAVGQTNN